MKPLFYLGPLIRTDGVDKPIKRLYQLQIWEEENWTDVPYGLATWQLV